MVTVTSYEALQSNLRSAPRRWLVTGVAGFIGSHLLETLLSPACLVSGSNSARTQREYDNGGSHH